MNQIEILSLSDYYSMAKQADVGRGENTTFGQYSAILEWLEMGNGENFRLITGQATKGMTIVIAGTK